MARSLPIPAVLLISLSFGLFFALGQHFFYAYLEGRSVSDDEFINHVSYQRFNTAVGLAFGFAVKVSLGVATSAAYIQVFWRAARDATKTQQLSALDTEFSALSNFFYLFKFHVWRHYPLMFILAVAAWCIPIAIIIAPAALSVQIVPQLSFTNRSTPAPTLDFASLNFATPLNDTWSDGRYWYGGPSYAVHKIATTVMTEAQILPITPPGPNSTWTSTFWGPSLHCDSAPQADQQAVWGNYLDFNWYEQDSSPYPGWPCYALHGYVSWMVNGTYSLPYAATTYSNGAPQLIYQAMPYNVPYEMYVITTPWTAENFTNLCFTGPDGSGITRTTDSIFAKAHNASQSERNSIISQVFQPTQLLKCQVTNDSYTVDFNYTNGAQTVNVHPRTAGQPLNATQLVYGPDPKLPHEASDPNCSTLNQSGARCAFNISTLHTLAYQSITDSFTSFLYGSLDITNPNVQTILMPHSKVEDTSLMETQELSYFQQYNAIPSAELGTRIQQQSGSAYHGISSQNFTTNKPSLSSTLETLFTNTVVSMMSELSLQPNYSSPFSPFPVSANLTSYHNVYAYKRPTLWIPYGVALIVACIFAAIGLLMIYFSDVQPTAYDSRFSTVLRVGRNADLIRTGGAKDIELENLGVGGVVGEGSGKAGGDDGRRPLPRELADATLVLRRGGSTASGTGMGMGMGIGAGVEGWRRRRGMGMGMGGGEGVGYVQIRDGKGGDGRDREGDGDLGYAGRGMGDGRF